MHIYIVQEYVYHATGNCCFVAFHIATFKWFKRLVDRIHLFKFLPLSFYRFRGGVIIVLFLFFYYLLLISMYFVCLRTTCTFCLFLLLLDTNKSFCFSVCIYTQIKKDCLTTFVMQYLLSILSQICDCGLKKLPSHTVHISEDIMMRKRPFIRSRSSKVIDFGTNRKRVYTFLLVINNN